MKNKGRDLNNLVTNYYDKGWLDLDAVIEVIAKDQEEEQLSETPLKDSASSTIEKKRRQILAWMDLVGASDAAKEAMRTGYYTEEQMGALHDIWLQEMHKSYGDTFPTNLREIPSRRRYDFSVFLNGVKPRCLQDRDVFGLAKIFI